MELKSRLVERMKEIDTAKFDHTQRSAMVEDESREILTINGSCDAEKVAGQGDFNIFSSISENNSIFQSGVKLDLKQAISSIKLAPSVEFIGDPEQEL